MKKIEIGPVSSDTLRNEDLLPCFLDFLESLRDESEEFPMHIQAIQLRIKASDIVASAYWESEEANEDVAEIFDYLEELAPEYVTFGVHPDDGAYFGFWPDVDGVDEDLRNSEIRTKRSRDMLEGSLCVDISDHGNVTLYRIKSIEYEEVWSVV